MTAIDVLSNAEYGAHFIHLPYAFPRYNSLHIETTGYKDTHKHMSLHIHMYIHIFTEMR
jgi:hypothetical protein